MCGEKVIVVERERERWELLAIMVGILRIILTFVLDMCLMQKFCQLSR